MLALILILLFFVLGVALGPLVLAALTVALDDDRGHGVADFAVGLGLKSVWKPVLTYTASDELTLKKRSYDEKHDSEYVSFGGLLSKVKRILHDPQDRLHPFYGTPFGFVDEVFGVVVDPRDVAVGEELRRARANSQYVHRVERSNGLRESVRAAFEIPQGQVGVQLSQASTLFGGSFDSQFVDRVRDIYETSQAPKGETSALTKLLVPLIVFAGVVLLSMFVAGNTGGAGGGGSPAPAPTPTPGGNNTTIEVGASLLLLFISTRRLREIIVDRWQLLKSVFLDLGDNGDDDESDDVVEPDDGSANDDSEDESEFIERVNEKAKSYRSRAADWFETARSLIKDGLEATGNPHRGNWRDRTVAGVLLVVGVAVAARLYLFFPPTVSLLGIGLPLGVWAVIALVVGMIVPAFVASFFGRSLGGLGMGLGKLYIVIGLLGYDQPVINFDGDRYELVEYDDRDWEIEPHWYRFAMTRIGIAFPNSEDVWPEGTTLHSERVETLANTSTTKRDAPDSHVITDAIAVDGIKGFLPKEPAADAVHVRTDRTTGWFFEAGQARRLMMAALQNAKRDFGGGEDPLSQKWLLGATLVSMAMAALFSWAVIF